eukprot:7023862-Ditylum_brightwellii.AAC.1
MIDTLGYRLSNDQFYLLFDNFEMLYKAMRDTGSISEALFDKIGIPPDTTSTSEVIHCNYGVSME